MLDPNLGHSAKHAHYLAKACNLAYYNQRDGEPKFRSELNLAARLVSVDNTQAWVGENEASIVVAFRGSEGPTSLDGFKDWLLTNARNFLVLPEGRIGTDFAAAGVGARFHRGFLEALEEIWEPLFASVEGLTRQDERPVWLTGHSLGGALALLCAWRMHQHFLPIHQVYTFGAPMIGNDATAKAYEKEFPGRIFRYVDRCDLVPKLPTMSLLSNQYGHCQQEIVIGDSLAEKAVEMLGNVADPTGAITSEVADSLWGDLHNGFSSHLMDNYLSQISKTIS